jgi:hypothetical protein
MYVNATQLSVCCSLFFFNTSIFHMGHPMRSEFPISRDALALTFSAFDFATSRKAGTPLWDIPSGDQILFPRWRVLGGLMVGIWGERWINQSPGSARQNNEPIAFAWIGLLQKERKCKEICSEEAEE